MSCFLGSVRAEVILLTMHTIHYLYDASNSSKYVSNSRAVRLAFCLKDKNCFYLQALKQET